MHAPHPVIRPLLVVAACIAMTACAGKQMVAQPDQTQTAVETTSGTSSGMDMHHVATANEVTGKGSGGDAPLGRDDIVYFDFDSSEVEQKYRAALLRHAQRLAADANARVRLDGHTDERGSAEYNIALGERRAQAVRRVLMLSGVRDGQITTVSYGEEKPAAAGMSESAWSMNRRVEIYSSAR